MILKKCYIENFGKLHAYTQEFSAGLNVIYQQNGWGKSTLAAFIKAMFFGLPATTKKDLDSNERKKYKPWQGGPYGGYVEFELGGKEYRLERFFGAKESEDTAKLFDLRTDKLAPEGADIVVQKFKLDAEAYERSTYLKQGNILTGINDNIRIKLGYLLDNTHEDHGFDEAVERLDEQRQFYSKKGNRGHIADLKDNLSEIRAKLTHCDELKRNIDNFQTDYEGLQSQMNALNMSLRDSVIKLDELKSQNAQAGMFEHLEDMKGELGRLQGEYDQTLTYFQGRVPEISEIDNCIQKSRELEALQGRLSSPAAVTHEFDTYFTKHLPTAEEIEKYVEKNRELEQVHSKLATARDTLNNVSARVRNTDAAPKRQIKWLLFAILGTVLGLGGVVAGALFNTLGWVLAGVGGLAAIACAILYFKSPSVPVQAHVPAMRDYQALSALIKELEIKERELDGSLRAFLSNFNEQGDYFTALSNVRSKLLSRGHLLEGQKSAQEGTMQLRAHAETLRAEVDMLLRSYPHAGEDMECLLRLRERAVRAGDLLKEIGDKRAGIEKFVKQNDLKGEAVRAADVSALRAEIEEKEARIEGVRNELARIKSRIAALSEEIEQRPELEAERARLENEIKAAEHKLEIIRNTDKYLRQAKDSLTSRYLEPMRASFLKYASRVVGGELDGVSFDSDLNVMVEKYGERKDKEYFSRGYRDIISLCMRFALIDALFSEEKPFVILDDPFVNLDDEKSRLAQSILDAFAQSYQVLHLVCHSSRSRAR